MVKKYYDIEYEEIYKGYHLVVARNMHHRCGYLGMKEHLPAWVDLDKLPSHFGFSYDRLYNETSPIHKEGYVRYLGFDCFHWGDKYDIEMMYDFGMPQKLIDLNVEFNNTVDGVVRTKEYVLDVLRKLADALKPIHDKESMRQVILLNVPASEVGKVFYYHLHHSEIPDSIPRDFKGWIYIVSQKNKSTPPVAVARFQFGKRWGGRYIRKFARWLYREYE